MRSIYTVHRSLTYVLASASNKKIARYRMAGNFGGKIFWRIAEIMTFGGIYFGG